jgi:hypothetical protein
MWVETATFEMDEEIKGRVVQVLKDRKNELEKCLDQL